MLWTIIRSFCVASEKAFSFVVSAHRSLLRSARHRHSAKICYLNGEETGMLVTRDSSRKEGSVKLVYDDSLNDRLENAK